MRTILELESRRLTEQARLDQLKNSAERNRWGQFATPPELARQITSYAFGLWESLGGNNVRFLDPALGTGAFYSAALQSSSAHQIQSSIGVELDPLFANAARTLWESAGLKVVEGDFTALDRRDQVNLVITNPPYVRHHHLSVENKDRMRQRIAEEIGINLNGLAGLYCHFLLMTHRWLEANALSVWLIPTEFMTVNYGKAIKDYLLQRVTLLHIHRFNPSDVQFADALVSSAVVVFQNRTPQPGHSVRFTFGGQLTSPQWEETVSVDELERTRRWTSFADSTIVQNAPSSGAREATLGDLFHIKRGIATGDNKFFVLPRSQAIHRKIPEQYCLPILPSPRYLTQSILETTQDGYPATDDPLCVIDCDLPEDALRAQFPLFWEYLEEGKQRRVDQGYLTSRRDPWYSQESRAPAPFLCTYMGRRTGKRGGNPFRFIWNKSQAIAANVYLLLYPKGPLKRMLDENPDLQSVVFDCLCNMSAKLCLDESRVYGGGLYKLEPRELGRVSAAAILESLGGLSRKPQQLLFV